VLSRDEDLNVDIAFIAKQLVNIGTWLGRKYGNETPEFGSEKSLPPFKSNFGIPDYSDPMQRFIAGFGAS
jgi:hypothetical protein